MLLVRKGFVHLLSVVLFLSLIGGAVAYSANRVLSKPAEIKSTLKEGKVYDAIINNALSDAKKSSDNIGTAAGTGPVSYDDPAVRSAAKSAFSPQLLEDSVNKFIDSNYAWLQGKTSQPNFSIDLTAAKQTFAQKVGSYAQNHYADLKICTPAQLEQIPDPANVDPLTAVCRPGALSPDTVGSNITEQVASNNSLVGDPVITAQTLGTTVGNDAQAKPYYQELSQVPRLYQLGQKLPLILGILVLLSLLGIIAIAPERRRGVRRVGIVLLEAGIVLVLIKVIGNLLFNRFEHKTLGDASSDPLQKSLANVANRLQDKVSALDLLIGTLLIVVAVAILAYIFWSRQSAGRSKVPRSPVRPAFSAANPPADQDTLDLTPRRPTGTQPDITGVRSAPTGPPQMPKLRPKKKPATKKPPRLIQ